MVGGRPAPVAGLLRKLGHRAWFTRLARWLVPADRAIARLTRGHLVTLRMRSLPCFMITTVGRRSGSPRTTPLLYATDGDGYVVIGSNFGQRHHPAWSANLLANPAASINIDGRVIPVRAELVRGSERARLWQLALQRWPAYSTYEQRAQRQIRIFRLTPTHAD